MGGGRVCSLATELGGVLFSLSFVDRASSSERNCLRFLMDLGRESSVLRLVADLAFLGFVGELGSLPLESLDDSFTPNALRDMAANDAFWGEGGPWPRSRVLSGDLWAWS